MIYPLNTQIATGFSSQSWKMKVLKQKMPIYDEILTDIIVIVYMDDIRGRY